MVTWLNALSKTRNKIAATLSRVCKRSEGLDDDAIEELEETLLRADVSLRLVMEWTAALQKGYRGLDLSRDEIIRSLLLKALGDSQPFDWNTSPESGPRTILLVGVNGTGKTTTAAKMAHKAKQAGRRPLLAATDTFRAAGSEQLRIWAERVDCPVVTGQQGADAAAVAYDGIDAALARGLDVVIIDTAGRMHTKKPLMNELGKVSRAVSSKLDRAPDETWIVLDASMGQNAITQARQFNDMVPLTGAVVTKLDGSAKAGFLFSIIEELKVPIRFAGLGEGLDDLIPFDPDAFVDALLGDDVMETASGS